jgi:hypothetical protein
MRKDKTMSQARAWEDAVERHNAALPKHRKDKHDFSKTVHSFGAWGHIGECGLCRQRAIFVLSDDQG